MTAVLAFVAAVVEASPIPWIDGGTALTFLGAMVVLVTAVFVFRTGANNRIDAKRESELTRVYARLTLVEETQGVIVRIAVRAIRQIENGGGAFRMSEEEIEVLERTRPLGMQQTEQEGTTS